LSSSPTPKDPRLSIDERLRLLRNFARPWTDEQAAAVGRSATHRGRFASRVAALCAHLDRVGARTRHDRLVRRRRRGFRRPTRERAQPSRTAGGTFPFSPPPAALRLGPDALFFFRLPGPHTHTHTRAHRPCGPTYCNGARSRQ
jgi:hypothetical protein